MLHSYKTDAIFSFEKFETKIKYFLEIFVLSFNPLFNPKNFY